MEIPTIEGMSPSILWITVYGIIAFCGIIVLFDKVKDVFRKHKKEKKEEVDEHDDTIRGRLDEISKKLAVIDEFMRQTDKRLNRDYQRINALEEQCNDTNQGVKALCRSSLAHLNHDITGNHVDTLKDALEEINAYLTGR